MSVHINSAAQFQASYVTAAAVGSNTINLMHKEVLLTRSTSIITRVPISANLSSLSCDASVPAGDQVSCVVLAKNASGTAEGGADAASVLGLQVDSMGETLTAGFTFAQTGFFVSVFTPGSTGTALVTANLFGTTTVNPVPVSVAVTAGPMDASTSDLSCDLSIVAGAGGTLSQLSGFSMQASQLHSGSVVPGTVSATSSRIMAVAPAPP